MKNSRTYIITGIITLLAIVGVGTYFMVRSAVPVNDMTGMDHSKTPMSSSSESATYKKYAALKGEEFDKAYLADMVVHHEGAMNMAEMANAEAVHQEIKDLAASINATQGQEVAKMNEYQLKWGYPKSSGHMMTGGDMSMTEGMTMMGEDLKGLTGEAFDKKFLELMIEHHQQAIDMSRPAATNAAHQEVKDLANAVITAQTKEINDMKNWQKQWGYKA